MNNETLDMLEKYLTDNNCFTGTLPDIVVKGVDCINTEAPYRMKLSIALTELIIFTSHLRKNIELQDGTLVPTNMISFILGKSGISKDSAANMMRSALSEGYQVIDEYRKDFAVNTAKNVAAHEGADENDWMRFYKKPKPLQAGLATEEGLMDHFATLQKGNLGAGAITSSEIGSELLSNANMINIIKTISIAYDLGKIPAKLIKSSENQTDEVKGLPVSAMLFGSEDGILYEESVKSKFRTAFSTQLARRSLFSFNPEVMEPLKFKSIEELTAYRKEERTKSIEAQKAIKTYAKELVISTNQDSLKVTDDVQALFDIYKEYNSFKSETINKLYPMTILARKHLQWKALKLSGSYAILEGNATITIKNYIDAINTVEKFSDDLKLFESELRKEPYEVFSDYMRQSSKDGKFALGVHTMRKMGFIPTTGSSTAKMKELCSLASAFDAEGLYTSDDKQIYYEKIEHVSKLGASYVFVEGTKEERQSKCASGYDYAETTFDNLKNLLNSDLAFSPFKFKDGVRKNDNVLGGTSWVCLDVDESNITDDELHYMLQDINHHIARTSNPDNEFKFRVIIELDSLVDIDPKLWKQFTKSIANHLNVKADLLPKSQIYFGYADRNVLSVTNKEAINAKEHILMAHSNNTKSTPDVSKYTKKQREEALSDVMGTFGYAMEAPKYQGSLKLITAAYHAKELGATTEEIINLIHEINNYWDYPMSADRLEKTIISQVQRFN